MSNTTREAIAQVTAAYVRDIRQHSGMTQESFAKCLGVSKAAVGHWENAVVIPTVEHLVMMMRKFSHRGLLLDVLRLL